MFHEFELIFFLCCFVLKYKLKIQLFFFPVYTDQPVSSKSPPTRDKLHPEGKAQVRIRNRNRNSIGQQDATDSGNCFFFL